MKDFKRVSYIYKAGIICNSLTQGLANDVGLVCLEEGGGVLLVAALLALLVTLRKEKPAGL